MKCHKCGAVVELEKVGRRDECERCGSDLHVCLNCTFYDLGKSNQCHEPQVERVTEKHRSNYCDYFQFKKDGGQARSEKQDVAKAWDELFKKK